MSDSGIVPRRLQSLSVAEVLDRGSRGKRGKKGIEGAGCAKKWDLIPLAAAQEVLEGFSSEQDLLLWLDIFADLRRLLNCVVL